MTYFYQNSTEVKYVRKAHLYTLTLLLSQILLFAALAYIRVRQGLGMIFLGEEIGYISVLFFLGGGGGILVY